MDNKIVLYYLGDAAGGNIARILEEDKGVDSIRSEESILYLEKLGGIEADVCIVASKHASGSGKPSLTCHSPGNFGSADMGGRDRTLAISPALYLRHALISMKEIGGERKPRYEVSFEATHHGPTELVFPVIFVEVGSTQKEWGDLGACAVAADVIADLVQGEPEDAPVAVGFGGGHYCRKFSGIEDYAIGHICPKYNLCNLDEKLIKEMISKTTPEPEYALIEWKGMGGEKSRILKLLNETGLEIKRI